MISCFCVFIECRSAFGGGECADALQLLEFFLAPAAEVFDMFRFAPFGGKFDQPLVARAGTGLIAQRGVSETNAGGHVLIGAARKLVRLGELLLRLRGLAEV